MTKFLPLLGLKLSKLFIRKIKNFSFLLSSKTWFELIVFPGFLAVLKSCGEAAPNFLGKNAFGLIQEYCTIEEIASFEGSPRFARLKPPKSPGELNSQKCCHYSKKAKLTE